MKAYKHHIFSPYRVCPIGAHVDHQHGLVTGFAIDKGVDLFFDVREDTLVKLSSETFGGELEFDITVPAQVRQKQWGDYARGAKYALQKRFRLTRGIEGVIRGSLPVGGLSSSAAVLIAYVMAFARANGIELQPFEVAQIASEAEREYIGLNNGLLDQACIALGRRDGLLFLDCDSNEYRVIARNPDMPPFEIGIFFSGLTRGIEGVIRGSLPVGGLSSSAAVLIAYVLAFARANGIELQPFEVAQIASEAEREYIGLNNGLLDQACIALGRRDGLLFLDCDSNEYRVIARNPDMPPFEIGIFFSGLTRSLVNSDYNLRVFECKTAAWNMLAYMDQPLKPFDKTFLRDIPKAVFEKTRIAMPQRFARRAEHFYSEYRRVRQGVTAWETGNLKLFGKLCFDSCESSIHNYECGSPELIGIYEILRSLPGVYGGRFSGAGFKGAVIALVDPAHKEDVERELTRRYLEEFPEYEKTFKVFWVQPDDGARFV